MLFTTYRSVVRGVRRTGCILWQNSRVSLSCLSCLSCRSYRSWLDTAWNDKDCNAGMDEAARNGEAAKETGAARRDDGATESAWMLFADSREP